MDESTQIAERMNKKLSMERVINAGKEFCNCDNFDCSCPIKRIKIGLLNNIIAYVQARVSCRKSGNNTFMGYKYSTYDEMVRALRPFINKYKFNIHFSHKIIEKFDQDIVIQPPEGAPITSKVTRVFLVTETMVLWEDIQSLPKITYVEITTTRKAGCDSSQSFNSLETGGKKRGLANFFCMIANDEADNEPDNLVYDEQEGGY